ncbi:hypothetical protein ACPV5U_23615 [Vibrio mediterranei]
MTPREQLSELINNIKKDVESGLYSLQNIFDRHLHEVNALKSAGINYATIYRYGKFESVFTEKHFMNLVTRANKKKELFNNNKNHELETPSQSVSSGSSNQKTTVTHSHSKQINPLNYDLVEWKMMLSDISENLVKDIVKHGYTLNDAQQWIRENQIPNSSVLRRHFNSIRFKKH